MRRAAWAALAAWVAAGVLGTATYANDYYLYRGFAPPKTPTGIPQGRLVKDHFYSRALNQRRSYLAYLPPGYASAAAHGRRLPVLYLLHAPPGRADGYVLAGALNARTDVLIAQRRIKPMIIVMPYGKSGRFGNDTEWANTPSGRYESFVMDTVRAVDGRYSTRADRTGRAVGGLSEGAYGATNIALHHPRAFSAFESWSGYFEQTPTLPFAGASPAALRANSPSAYIGALSPKLHRLPMRAFLYAGTRDGYPRAKMRSFAGQLTVAGVRATYAVYPGGHTWKLWRAQLPHMLEFASSSFTARR